MAVRLRELIFLLAVLCGINGYSQIIDNTSTFKNSSDKYIRFHYDNDYFTKTDDYYTQGMSLEYVHPGLQKFPLTRLLYKPKESHYKYGISFDHYAYTPTTIRSDDILYGNRPFCASISFKTFLIATNEQKRQRIATTVIVGLMGPGAGGKEMQTTIHRWLGAITPHGWQHQVRNDVIADYQVNYEKQVLSHKNSILVNAVGKARIGLHQDNLKGGFNFMVGRFDDPYALQGKNKKLRCYLYGQLVAGVTGYDATLQGGLFNRKSPYIISSNDMTRLTLQGDYGIVVRFSSMYLEYCQSFITKEFNTGHLHRWGGIRIGVGL
ncbi:MAG: lipid A deacylase LpxR family protein [Chitinophagaceae bacterium]